MPDNTLTVLCQLPARLLSGCAYMQLHAAEHVDLLWYLNKKPLDCSGGADVCSQATAAGPAARSNEHLCRRPQQRSLKPRGNRHLHGRALLPNIPGSGPQPKQLVQVVLHGCNRAIFCLWNAKFNRGTAHAMHCIICKQVLHVCVLKRGVPKQRVHMPHVNWVGPAPGPLSVPLSMILPASCFLTCILLLP